MSNTDPLFCTVIEPHKNWINTAALLVQSLRLNGGQYAQRPFVICVAGITSKLQLIFEDQHLFIFGTSRNPTIPHLNKLIGLRLGDFLPFSHLILLDHDTVVLHLNDLSDFLTNEVYARRNYKHHLAHVLGNDYMKALSATDLPPWTRIHYFNSGVIFVPQLYCRLLEEHWHFWAEKLSGPFEGKAHTEEIAFALALVHAGIPYKFLPVSYNQTSRWTSLLDAAIIHYDSSNRINQDIRKRIIYSFEDLRSFLDTTDNHFWQGHAPAIKRLLTEELENLADKIYSLVETCRLAVSLP
ncbi:MAG TPA: hypothetical protein VKV40_16215 [Ktedonobacteraceae bacterium]|nr:hypothetical protein [Ktedonobacteraceae bacterium]